MGYRLEVEAVGGPGRAIEKAFAYRKRASSRSRWSWDLGLGSQVLTLRADAGNCSSAGGGWRSVAAVGPPSRASERDTPTLDAARDRMMAAAAGVV